MCAIIYVCVVVGLRVVLDHRLHRRDARSPLPSLRIAPHRAEVNRVSFGLLNEDDCARALAVDPCMPRSRLKLAVPFVGKDVPSAASEFAHPDVTIGASVLAYRYSGES